MMFGMRRWVQRRSLGRQLLLPLLLFEVVSLLIIGSIMFVSYQGQLSGTQRLQQEAAARAAIAVETYLKGLQGGLSSAGLSEKSVQDPELGQQALGRLQAGQSAYTALALVDSTGRERARLTALSGAPALPGEWSQQPALSSILIGIPYNSPAEFYGGLPYMVMAAPIRDAELRVTGMLAVQVELSSLWPTVTGVKNGSTGYVYVIDRAPNLIMARELEMVMRRPDVKGLAGVQAALSNDQQPINAYQGLSGQDVIGGVQPVAGTDWKVIAELPTAEAYASLQLLAPLLAAWIVVGGSLAVGVLFYANRRIVAPILEIQRGAQIIGGGDLAHRLTVKAGGELADLAQVINGVTAQLQSLVGGLEQRVAERTAILQRRSLQLQATTEVARAAAAELDVETLMRTTVARISNRFDYYHAGIFLLDEKREYAVLRAASSEGGQRMLARGHRLRIKEGIVGYVADKGQARIALDVGKDAVYFSNPDLPQTRSEMALPLLVREQVIGILDVQSTEPSAFGPEDVTTLQALADQVALAINNAHLFGQVQASLEAERRAYGELTRQAWTGLLRARTDRGVRYDPQGILPGDGLWRQEMKKAMQTGETVRGEEAMSAALATPIKVRDQVIGVVDAHKPAGAGAWSPAEIALLETLVGQLGVALDSARLYQDTQRRAAREQLVGEITARVRGSLDVSRVLQTAAREFAQALGASEVNIRLSPDLQSGELRDARQDGDKGCRSS